MSDDPKTPDHPMLSLVGLALHVAQDIAAVEMDLAAQMLMPAAVADRAAAAEDDADIENGFDNMPV